MIIWTVILPIIPLFLLSLTHFLNLFLVSMPMKKIPEVKIKETVIRTISTLPILHQTLQSGNISQSPYPYLFLFLLSTLPGPLPNTGPIYSVPFKSGAVLYIKISEHENRFSIKLSQILHFSATD